MSIAAILSALAAIPQILGYVESFASAVTSWYIQKQKAETLSAISDACALTARAQNEQDRYAAMAALQKALSRDRFIT